MAWRDLREFVEELANPRRDVVIADGPVDELDHAAPHVGVGSKMGIDATGKIPGAGAVRPWPRQTRMTDEVRQLVTERWGELGLGDVPF